MFNQYWAQTNWRVYKLRHEKKLTATNCEFNFFSNRKPWKTCALNCLLVLNMVRIVIGLPRLQGWRLKVQCLTVLGELGRSVFVHHNLFQLCAVNIVHKTWYTLILLFSIAILELIMRPISFLSNALCCSPNRFAQQIANSSISPCFI